jgi:2,4-dienoyl-CoA reductase-like NADH-dependent reductase (Old Yellow Enzyme family)
MKNKNTIINPMSSLHNNLTLPCGVVLKNRLAKAAMSDSLGDGEGNPTQAQIRLYEKWAKGGVGISFVGEVQCDPRFPEKPGNLVLGEHSNLKLLRELTQRSVIDGAHLWAQIGHAGALTPSSISQPVGPSALNLEGLTCLEMSLDEIKQLPEKYAKSALLAKKVGFSGVHIHAGHGFLLSQFLSPLFNHRTDNYGGSIENRCRIILEIIEAVRNAVGDLFPIGIRINSSDQMEGGLSEADALKAIRLLDKTSLDLIDISGGTYFPGVKGSSEGVSKGPYFVHFAEQAKQITQIPLMVTGGFTHSAQAVEVINKGFADVIGLGRSMVIEPRLADRWLNEAEYNPTFPRFESLPPGGLTAWYTMRLTAIGEDWEESFELDLPSAIQQYEERDNQRVIQWRKRFKDL